MAELSANLESQIVESLSRLPEFADRTPALAEVLVIHPGGQKRLHERLLSGEVELSGSVDVGSSADRATAAQLVVFLAANAV